MVEQVKINFVVKPAGYKVSPDLPEVIVGIYS
jgi:hypothetical protein